MFFLLAFAPKAAAAEPPPQAQEILEQSGADEAAGGAAEPAAQGEDFWNKDEAELTAPDQKQPAEVDYSAFQGVQFSK